MIATLPELALKSAEPLLEGLQSCPVAATAEEADDLLLLVLERRELFRRCWERTLAKLGAGMSGSRARDMLGVMLKLANVRSRITAITLEVAGQRG
jgi:hypothetical protein